MTDITTGRSSCTLPRTVKSVGERNHVNSMYVAESLGCMRRLCRRGVIKQ